jgi:hypothetical protein
VLQPPLLQKASGRHRSRVISAFIPQKRSRLMSSVSADGHALSRLPCNAVERGCRVLGVPGRGRGSLACAST